MTQEQLAEKLNVAARTVSRWETGNNMPDLSLLIELSDFYDVSVGEIIKGKREIRNVDENVQDTLKEVADYTDIEKEKTLKSFITTSVLVAIAIFFLLITTEFNLEEKYHGIGSLKSCVMILALGMLANQYLNAIKIKYGMSKFLKAKNIVMTIQLILAFLPFFVGIGMLAIDILSSKIIVNDNIGDYNKYIGETTEEIYRDKLDMDESILPDRITDDMQVKDYKGIYNVSGVTKYRLVAMNSDEHQGFIYALTDGQSKIIYVELLFCNYFMDLDYEDYISEDYLPDGFDATSDNTYRDKMLSSDG